MSSFYWRDLLAINSSHATHLSPLACVAHIDVNAFFAQVEQVRCGYGKDDPVVCVQWSSVIAVSYACRKYGITRLDSVAEAMKKCPTLIPIHTAVFKKGEDFWQYHDGYGPWNTDPSRQLDPAIHKVALDPYRRESRKLLKMIQKRCPIVEKASIDEVFVDLGPQCFAQLLLGDDGAEFQELRRLFVEGSYSLDEPLPPLPRSVKLQFAGDVYGADAERTSFLDWDDVIMCLGSRLALALRQEVEDALGYTTSCGVSRTKSVSKLASNYRKPNAQTIVRNAAVETFLDQGGFELPSFWTLGGAIGKELLDLLELPPAGSIPALRALCPESPEQLHACLLRRIRDRPLPHDAAPYLIDEQAAEALATKLFYLVRGTHCVPVNPRPTVSSMTSRKNMRGNACKSLADCHPWLEVFSAELAGRLQDLHQEYDRIYLPRTLTVAAQGRAHQRVSRSTGLHAPTANVTALTLLKAGARLVNELDERFCGADMYPLSALSMSLANFDVLQPGKTIVDLLPRAPATPPSPPARAASPASLPAAAAAACPQCRAPLPSQRALQVHLDGHLAQKLSDSLNGVSDASALSYGERRLLLRPKHGGPAAPKKQRRTTKDIASYFGPTGQP
ncbi:AAR136Wp [Eremothecium gossypii ATCC 10895]|uniref:DNA polymerase eta n=1 Tax=Eremothecium gossypii (strain ATCC 10895 / CBS 109.51 / FGSC 9923 / NRRL Y-1056) TaxID=284811 RepID=Q75EE5_EREGS|nr:AAR136Wp [Eremothecium gossypii ATCC 10895]AAS50502.2 AAR136Wp [Eremothecium gossypii ATCC 10895]AEY94789.1 FAAR136Wp [Eremothecium gossypii FDAG1]